jgi:hypothetical protein
LIDAFPIELAELVGYFGPASGAATAFRGLAEGLDTAIVRVVAARPGTESITAVMEACQPTKLPPWPSSPDLDPADGYVERTTDDDANDSVAQRH